MARVPLVERGLLDPRPAAVAAADPLADAVNIPLAQLPARTHELPPREETIQVGAAGPLATETVAWLARAGRRAVAVAASARAPADEATIGRLWRPNAYLAEIAPQLAPGTALVLACGSGRDAVYLAARGWQVTAVDVLPDALDRARALALRCAPAIEPVTWLQADLERDPPVWTGRFDLIVAIRYLHRPLLARLADRVAPGGSIVYETFTALHRARHGRPAAAARVLRPGELPELLAGLEIRRYAEGWHGPAHTARAWAVRH